MKKKIVMVLASLAVASAITACGSSTSATSSARSAPAAASSEAPAASSATEQAESTATASYATMDAFNQIKTGMTLDEVNKIFGFEGTKQASGSAAAAGMSSTMEVYTWAGEAPGSSASVYIMDGKVASMAQVGLQ